MAVAHEPVLDREEVVLECRRMLLRKRQLAEHYHCNGKTAERDQALREAAALRAARKAFTVDRGG